MIESQRVLIVDDRIGDIIWLLELIRSRGYEVVLATHEEAAKKRLMAIKEGKEEYSLAIIDVMVATGDLLDLVNLDDQFEEDSRNAGIRLCRMARRDLGLSPEALPIACLTAREDEEVKRAMKELGIPLFHRAPHSPEESIRKLVEQKLPPLR